MSFTDWFKKAKDAKKKAEKKKPNEFGNLGSRSKAYKEAQDALEDANEKGGAQYADSGE